MDGYEVNSPFHPPDQYLMLSTNHDIKNSRPRRSLTEIYKATQRIRSYEKKHQIPASKIIALTALGSEAAYKEAFGSGCETACNSEQQQEKLDLNSGFTVYYLCYLGQVT